MSEVSKFPIGKVAIAPKGNYNATLQYEPYDLVTYGGSSFLAKQNVKGITPGNNTYWQLIAISGSGGPALDSNGILYWPTA